MCLAVPLRVALGDPHVEVGFHLVDEADLLAGELAARARQRAQVRADERGAVVVRARRAVGEQSLRLPGQVGGVRTGLGGHRPPERGIAGERVDIALLDPVEAQSEQQVVADQGRRISTGVHTDQANCKTVPMARLSEPSPYVEFDRSQWRALRMSTPLKLTEDELVRLRGLGEKIDLLEVEEVYLPLARLIHLQVAARQALFAATAEFLGEPQQNPDRPVPFVIGVAGSVAVGKSTTARVLQALLARWEHHPRVDLVTTDGFLYSERGTVTPKPDAPQRFSRKL